MPDEERRDFHVHIPAIITFGIPLVTCVRISFLRPLIFAAIRSGQGEMLGVGVCAEVVLLLIEEGLLKRGCRNRC